MQWSGWGGSGGLGEFWEVGGVFGLGWGFGEGHGFEGLGGAVFFCFGGRVGMWVGGEQEGLD